MLLKMSKCVQLYMLYHLFSTYIYIYIQYFQQIYIKKKKTQYKFSSKVFTNVTFEFYLFELEIFFVF